MNMPIRESFLPHISLADNDVHLWRINLDVPARRQSNLDTLLSQPECDRAARFQFARDRHRFVVSHAILRLTLSRYLNCDPEQIQYQIQENGKPLLANMPQLHFNLAHSHELALIAVTQLGEIGVDVEFIRPLQDMVQLARQCFSMQEFLQFKDLPASERHQAFFTCWTRKEAFLKALGFGLAYPLENFTVSLLRNEPGRLVMVAGNPDEAAKWTLQGIDIDPDYAAAYALREANPIVKYKDWV